MRKHIIPISYVFVFNIQLVFCCVFPDDFQGQTWFTNIRATTKTAIYFRSKIMEHEDLQTKQDYVERQYEYTCVSMVALNKYIVVNKAGEFRCVHFIKRSKSIMQLKYSKFSKNDSDSDLCSHRRLELHPWLLIHYPSLQKEFTLCPISGGYNMKIKLPDGTDHPCNFIDLPMRFESECLKGEAISFYFRSKHCIGSLPMAVSQRALCVTHWRSDGDVIVILRDPDNDSVWCLRIPARNSYSDRTRMLLFTDGTCETATGVKFYTLELELVVQNTLCTDEHENCHLLPCSQHFESQCLQNCGKCNPNVYPTSCDFPKRYRGDWLIQDSYGTSAVSISNSRVSVDRLGSFNCIDFDDSPSRRFKQFTTLTFFINGCRPRYTCLAFKSLNDNILGFSVSQSKVWPLPSDQTGAMTCDPSSFHGDPAPLRDTFRSFSDVFKPLVSTSRIMSPVTCPFQSTYQFNATFSNGTICGGAFYKMCQEESILRVQFHQCPSAKHVVDEYSCLGTVESKYWERILLIHNINNDSDTRCLISSDVEPRRMIMLPSGECDKYSWTNSDAGLRSPILDLQITPLQESCRQLTTTQTVTKLQHLPQPINDAWKVSRDAGEDMTSYYHGDVNLVTHKHRHHKGIHTSTQTYRVITADDTSHKIVIHTTNNGLSFTKSGNILIYFTIVSSFLYRLLFNLGNIS